MRIAAPALAAGLVLAFTTAADTPARAQARAAEPARQKEQAGFAEPRHGDVPEGSAELVTPEAERAIERGLRWLADQQNDDGTFGNGAYRTNVAVTSLGGLAMMASGSSPGRGPYGPQIDKAIQSILDNTSPSGFITAATAPGHGPMYGHGFGTLFLAEAYGMTHRPEIREKLEKAVRLVVDTQNRDGGWRYQPVRADADLSVTICQINALRAARNAGLYVPRETVERCIKYVKRSQNPDGGFRYVLNGGGSGFPRSAAGVVALYSAAVYDAKEVDAGIAYLKKFAGELRFGHRQNHYFYGHYYAAQAMWIRGGEDWSAWYPAIRDELVHRQIDKGAWVDGFGNEYGTAMALIVLQMPNSYLPIFQR